MENKPTGTGVPKVGPGERHMSIPGPVLARATNGPGVKMLLVEPE